MNILGGLGGDMEKAYDPPTTGQAMLRPRTIEERIADQIRFHESKLVDLRAAQEILKNSEILKALEALQKLSY